MPAPVASGWSGRRAGLAPAGKAPPCHGARGLRAFPICVAWGAHACKRTFALWRRGSHQTGAFVPTSSVSDSVRLNLDASLYTLLQILSVTLFEKMMLCQIVTRSRIQTQGRCPMQPVESVRVLTGH